jgi:hypothetical protein
MTSRPSLWPARLNAAIGVPVVRTVVFGVQMPRPRGAVSGSWQGWQCAHCRHLGEVVTTAHSGPQYGATMQSWDLGKIGRPAGPWVRGGREILAARAQQPVLPVIGVRPTVPLGTHAPTWP